ncbi:hypothetical protein [Listeria booriae]|uniref:hypothetical protein n=1 Tax=Listeria booriae TaxID=1552123 RepID=UPI00162A6E36|nr:hypothetical protein [Listeria booriae]MBC2173904.1 hypothetical protein [Listeria booriae]MDT0111599.1 hypothetical protein [Listeria booriae]
MPIKRDIQTKSVQKGLGLSSKVAREAPDGIIKRLVESNNGKSINALAETSGLSESTLRTANLKPVKSLQIPTILGISKAMEMTPGNVLDELIEIESNLFYERLENILKSFKIDNEIADVLAEKGIVVVSYRGNCLELINKINKDTIFFAFSPEQNKEAIIIQKESEQEKVDFQKKVQFHNRGEI